MRKVKYDVEDLKKAIGSSKSIAGVLRQMDLRPTGGNYRIIHRMIRDNQIDTSHFTGQGWNVGLGFKPNVEFDDSEIFIQDSPYKCSWRLRERYKKLTGITFCESCQLDNWMGRPMP